MNPIFQAISDANRAYCRTLGMASAELYGTPPSPQEYEVVALITDGVPAEAATPRATTFDQLTRIPESP